MLAGAVTVVFKTNFPLFAQYLCRQIDSRASVLDAADGSPILRRAQSNRQPHLNAEPEVAFRPKPAETDAQQRPRSPSITPENVNQINHLRGQFRFVDDAQRLFRPLLESIGVNIKVCGCYEMDAWFIVYSPFISGCPS